MSVHDGALNVYYMHRYGLMMMPTHITIHSVEALSPRPSKSGFNFSKNDGSSIKKALSAHISSDKPSQNEITS
jgi:hypothetical protein